jgi:pyruvate/2-oxoglutarate dehydrogenase complex dihydrolipoamide acyltransferase (E2) component
MTSAAITADQVAEAEQRAEQAQRGRGVWVAVMLLTILVSLGLNIAHPFVYEPEPVPNMPLSDGGRTLLGLLSGLLPVTMQAFMSHAIFTDAPGGVRFIVLMIFIVGMGMSISHQYQLFLPAVGELNAMGTVAVIDVPALTALFMIERGNRARRAAERAAAERAEAERERQAAEAARVERLQATERRRAEEDRARAEREAQRQAERERAEQEKAIAEQAKRGDLTAEQKRAIIRAAYQADPTINAPAAKAAVEGKGGTISDQRARAVLADVRAEAAEGLSNVRPLRSTATG